MTVTTETTAQAAQEALANDELRTQAVDGFFI